MVGKGLTPLLTPQVHATTSEGLTPLHFACRFGHKETVLLLLSRGAHVDYLDLRQQ